MYTCNIIYCTPILIIHRAAQKVNNLQTAINSQKVYRLEYKCNCILFTILLHGESASWSFIIGQNLANMYLHNLKNCHDVLWEYFQFLRTDGNQFPECFFMLRAVKPQHWRETFC